LKISNYKNNLKLANAFLYSFFSKLESVFKKKHQDKLSLDDLWSEKFNKFKNKELIVHAGIKRLITHNAASTTVEIIEFLEKKFEPTSIISQSYSPSFRRSGIFSSKFSRAEIGAFAEEFRKFSNRRTPDPIHSVSYISKNLSLFKSINYKDTFGEDGFFASLYFRDAVQINIDTNRFISTYLHFLEEQLSVPYKHQNSIFEGFKVDDKVMSIKQKNHSYKYPLEFNRRKIYKYLKDNNVIFDIEKNASVIISIVKIKDMHDLISEKILKDPYYLVTF